MISIREMDKKDVQTVATAFSAQGWQKPIEQYEAYLQETIAGIRVVLLAEFAGMFAGYLSIVWESKYSPFRDAGIPEIVDFNVLLKYQRRGIGTALMDEAERRIRKCSEIAGISVGLMADYGNAQILYVKRGYLPDGRGICRHGHWLSYGDQLTMDDDVALYLTKNLATVGTYQLDYSSFLHNTEKSNQECLERRSL